MLAVTGICHCWNFGIDFHISHQFITVVDTFYYEDGNKNLKMQLGIGY